VPDIEAWLLGSAEENEVHRTLWQQLENAADAGDLLGLVGRLTQTAPFRTARTRADFVGRVWRVLEVATHSTEDRLLFNGMAQQALVQPGTGDQTCHDGAWLVFNQIEIRIFTEQSLKDVPATLRGPTLYRLTRRLYRLHELDDIAREQAGTRDEAEVRLAYRLRWASELDLPLPPSNMLYEAHANIRPAELDQALARVQQGESREPFMRYAAQRDFWVEYLREVYATRFEALEQAHTARLQDLPDRFPGSAIGELAEQFAALQRQFEVEEQNLIRELTNREGLDHG
jgi:ribosome modulation factor